MGSGLARVTQFRLVLKIQRPLHVRLESSTVRQSPKHQAARILASSLSRVIQEDVRQGRRAGRGVEPAHPRARLESVQGAGKGGPGVVALSVQQSSGQHCPLVVEEGTAEPPGRVS